jgi:hypothetical protein
VIRLGSCKRSAAELVRDLPVSHGHVQRFLSPFPSYAGWRVERVSIAPQLPQDFRQEIARKGSLVRADGGSLRWKGSGVGQSAVQVLCLD